MYETLGGTLAFGHPDYFFVFESILVSVLCPNFEQPLVLFSVFLGSFWLLFGASGGGVAPFERIWWLGWLLLAHFWVHVERVGLFLLPFSNLFECRVV